MKYREIAPGASRPDDILKQITPTLTPHYFRHNYVTLCRASVNMGYCQELCAKSVGRLWLNEVSQQ